METNTQPANFPRTMVMIGAALLAGIATCWTLAFTLAPTDSAMGDVYRIIYLHVPSAFTAFFNSLLLFIFCIHALRKTSEASLRRAKAVAEVGLLFTILTLATGSIWGRPTWGAWWTWDARLTTTLILALLFIGFIMLHSSLPPSNGRIKACSVLGILIFLDVPIIYKSVTWWRTLHQPPSLIRKGGPTMDPEIVVLLLASAAMLVSFAFLLGWARARNLELRDRIEAAYFNRMKG